MNKKMNFIKKYVLQFNLWIGFIISYTLSQLIIYYMSGANFFKSPMYILLPIFAYFAMYFITPILIKNLNLKKWVLITTFSIIGIFAMYTALYIYHWDILKILNNAPIKFGFWKIFLDSAYLEFLVSGIIGILFYKE